ncbi:MAG: hypothetical protein UR69_C0001G0228 [Candidatus Moranbacteria bacterium GW2011_GWE2_35_2-]|nr:MAG: hypothetical protein UR69_C0001G0228 [Candidatus Moranbacteria bacterium GW2011_GWE2_35_2-]KKQ04507.1 MAG: hypothetical protein US15_C0053G0004 [Candidatus Moranbacteria bacterium GW2011_GWF1_36_4]KKQ22774.1 MAG: hypothetical protein US37_C0001G0046 [Candidatus Moranbacteria bacterium GW2011_GWF2_37_11]KKQ28785.1 MAG: hypothetical protein US44_C0006G0005 [Candidatus Moranbacteria bacterium GW2011_GWD1_37_17]KKQ30995.1 MAG: hypothetical protein US47_C0001G0228 [Candidatus Moranbacteria b
MDKKSKILIAVFIALIFISIGATFWRIVIKKDYIIESQVDCDPYSENCFVWECDPESFEEGEACTGNMEEDVWYFKVVRRNASDIPFCDPDADEECEPFLCSEGEKDCGEEFCTEENMENYSATSCNDPAIFSAQNPIEETDKCLEEDDCAEDAEALEEAGEEEEIDILENQEEDLNSEEGDITKEDDDAEENMPMENADQAVPIEIIPL